MADEAPGATVAPPASGGLAVGPAELEVTLNRVLRVWWALAWRSLLSIPLGAAVGCVIGFVVGLTGHAAGASPARIQLLVQILTVPVGLVLGLLVGFWAVWSVLRKQFREFRIALIAR
jgi:hypothetical protein